MEASLGFCTGDTGTVRVRKVKKLPQTSATAQELDRDAGEFSWGDWRCMQSKRARTPAEQSTRQVAMVPGRRRGPGLWGWALILVRMDVGAGVGCTAGWSLHDEQDNAS